MPSAADAGSEAEGDAQQAMISTVFDRTADEMRGLVAQGRGRRLTLAFYPLESDP